MHKKQIKSYSIYHNIVTFYLEHENSNFNYSELIGYLKEIKN